MRFITFFKLTSYFFITLTIIISENIKAEEKKPYRIGIILPLSGSAASLGNYAKNGIDLAYSILPEDKKKQIELFYEDDELKSTKAVSAFKKLQSEKDIRAALVISSGIGNSIAPLAEKAGIVLIAIGASDKNITAGRKYSFTHWVTPDKEANKLTEEIKKRAYKKIAIVGTEQDGALAVLKEVKRAFQENSISERVVVEQNFLPGETDFKSEIAKIKGVGADVVIVILFPGALSSFAKQTKALGYKGDLVGLELFEDENEVQASEGALVGHWYVNADVVTPRFNEIYKERYNMHAGFGTANSFDALNLIVEGLVAVGNDNNAISNYLSTLKNYDGAAGKYSATGDNRFDLPVAIKVVKKDGFEKLH